MDRSDGAFSAFVSDTLDNMGYDSNTVQHRRDMYKEAHGSKDFIIAGSKGEGITRFFENDIDAMFVRLDIGCAEDVCYTHEVPLTLFEMDRRCTVPGYTRLRSGHSIFDQHVVFDLLDRDTAIGYVSHSLLEQAMVQFTGPYYFGKQGPSFYIKNIIGQQGDIVPSIKCFCPSILTSWLSRRRTNDWPSQHTITEVSTLDAHVVSVGYKHSPHKNIEWRICFTLAELALIHSLNDTQLKMYILLKFIAKSVLKPVCDAMTSYVMKNIVLWVCENTPCRLFTSRLLVERLLQCLKILRLVVKHKSIPSYMIPERNLFIERKVPGQQQRLLSLLSELIDEGPCLLFRCEKLRLAMVKMYKSPEAVRQECQKKNQVERLMLLIVHTAIRNGPSINENMTLYEHVFACIQQCSGSMLQNELCEKMVEIVLPDLLPDLPQLVNSGENLALVIHDRFTRLLS